MAKLILSMLVLVAVVTMAYGVCKKPRVTMRPNRKGGDGQRIVGGVESKPHSFPPLVSIQSGKDHFCGGALIEPTDGAKETKFVLTAAHCVYDEPTDLTVTAGAHDLGNPSGREQTAKVAKWVMHQQYDHVLTINDIAILFLKTPIVFNAYAQPACLPTADSPKPDDSGTEGTVAGWGKTDEYNWESSKLLMQAAMPTMKSSRCATLYEGEEDVVVDPNMMICAGYENGTKRDSCQGDSGGPYIFPASASGPYVQHGVVSFGIGCARPGKPGVYARVANYLDWIDQTVEELINE